MIDTASISLLDAGHRKIYVALWYMETDTDYSGWLEATLLSRNLSSSKDWIGPLLYYTRVSCSCSEWRNALLGGRHIRDIVSTLLLSQPICVFWKGCFRRRGRFHTIENPLFGLIVPSKTKYELPLPWEEWTRLYWHTNYSNLHLLGPKGGFAASGLWESNPILFHPRPPRINDDWARGYQYANYWLRDPLLAYFKVLTGLQELQPTSRPYAPTSCQESLRFTGSYDPLI